MHCVQVNFAAISDPFTELSICQKGLLDCPILSTRGQLLNFWRNQKDVLRGNPEDEQF